MPTAFEVVLSTARKAVAHLTSECNSLLSVVLETRGST